MTKFLTGAPPPFEGTEVHTLPNGLTLILKEDHTTPVVAMQAWVRCGAVDETPKIYGISHGLEHMVFKGTPSRSAGEITSIIESNGGSINAATQLETTHYYIDVPSYGADAALDVLVDTILHPTFPQDELERERLVILEEIHRRDDSPDATLWDEFISSVFKNTPYGIKVIGNTETVSNLSREDLHAYFHAHYVPQKISMVVVGDINAKATLKKLTRQFGALKPQQPPRVPTIHLNGFKPVRVNLKKPVQLSYIGMGFPTIGLGHKDLVALDMLADILGGGTSSRFFQRIREEKELALTISCDYIAFQQKGLFSFFIEALPATGLQAIETALDELNRLKKEPINREELKRAKARVKSHWLYSAETPHGQASSLGNMSVLGHLELISIYLRRIEALSVDDIMNAYETHVRGRNFSITKLDPQ